MAGGGRGASSGLTVPTAELAHADHEEVGVARRDAHPPAWVVWAGLTAVLLLSVVWRPSEDGPVLCPFRALTGLPCPGCGMTRGFCALGDGDVRAAFGYNALSPALYLVAIAAWVGAGARMLGRPLPALARLRWWATRPTVGFAMIAAVLAWWAVRLIWGL